MTTLRPSSTAIRRLRVERLGEEGEGVGRLEGVDVHVPGGTVTVEVTESTSILTGPSRLVARGEIELSALRR